MRFYKIGHQYINLDTVIRVVVAESAEGITAYVYCVGTLPATTATGDILGYNFTLTGAEAEVLLTALDNAIAKDETFGAPSA
jgi:hypothetical protein